MILLTAPGPNSPCPTVALWAPGPRPTLHGKGNGAETYLTKITCRSSSKMPFLKGLEDARMLA